MAARPSLLWTMARLNGVERGASLLARLIFYFTRKRLGRVVAPIRVHAVHGSLLMGYGQMEWFQERARLVPHTLKALASLRAATRIGCPF